MRLHSLFLLLVGTLSAPVQNADRGATRSVFQQLMHHDKARIYQEIFAQPSLADLKQQLSSGKAHTMIVATDDAMRRSIPHWEAQLKTMLRGQDVSLDACRQRWLSNSNYTSMACRISDRWADAGMRYAVLDGALSAEDINALAAKGDAFVPTHLKDDKTFVNLGANKAQWVRFSTMVPAQRSTRSPGAEKYDRAVDVLFGRERLSTQVGSEAEEFEQQADNTRLYVRSNWDAAKVVESVKAGNGWLHIVDRVVDVPWSLEAELLAGKYDMQFKGLRESGLLDDLSTRAGFTFFMPTTRAIDEVRKATQGRNFTQQDMRDAIERHISNDVLLPSQLTGADVRMRSGSFPVTQADVQRTVLVRNGIVHVVDKLFGYQPGDQKQ